MKRAFFITVLLLMSLSSGQALADQKKTYAEWKKAFKNMKPGISRVEAEEAIENERGIKSRYELYAMDTSDIVAYRLDEEYILIVWYKPGMPAMRTDTGEHYPPEDGKYLKHRVTRLR